MHPLATLIRLNDNNPRVSREQLHTAVREKLQLKKADVPDKIIDGVFRYLQVGGLNCLIDCCFLLLYDV